MVGNKKLEDLSERMERLNIREEDLLEKFVKSSKPGGQKSNKASSCVYLKHIPTGIEVKCERTRSQSLNRYYARKILLDKLEEVLLGRESKKRKEIEKRIKQKRKLRKRALKKLKAISEDPNKT